MQEKKEKKTPHLLENSLHVILNVVKDLPQYSMRYFVSLSMTFLKKDTKSSRSADGTRLPE